MVRVRAMAVFVIALACYACGGGTASPPATSSNPSASATPASTASSGPAEFGVPECDDYLKKYEACIDKLAPAAKDAARQAIDQSRAAWKQAAATEQGKAALATTCKAASDAAAPGLRAQGCAW
jgi:hypothetical protein